MSAKTAYKLMKNENGSNSTIWNPYPDSTVDLWNQNIVNEYIIAYELNSGLDYKLQDMLPEVCFYLQIFSLNNRLRLFLRSTFNFKPISLRMDWSYSQPVFVSD